MSFHESRDYLSDEMKQVVLDANERLLSVVPSTRNARYISFTKTH